MAAVSPDTPRVRRLAVRVAGLLLALLVVAGIERLDELTGPDYGFSLFYLGPVVLVGWFLGGFLAVLTGLCAAIAWLLAELDIRPLDTLAAVIWNSSSRLVIFVAVGWLTSRVRLGRDEILAANLRLAALLGQESRLARTDPITELPNWRAFEERLGIEIARARRSGQHLCVGYLDLDNFKRVNDRYGHNAGDALLRRIAQGVREVLRPEDELARMGGDEFAFLLGGAQPAQLEEVGQRVLARIHEIAAGYPDTQVSASVGMVCGLPLRRGQEELIALADQAMYQAKRAGKGRVRTLALDLAPPPQAPASPPPGDRGTMPPDDDRAPGPERSGS